MLNSPVPAGEFFIAPAAMLGLFLWKGGYMQRITLVAIAGITFLAIASSAWWWSNTRDRQPAIAILQTASHPALDAVRTGCTQVLQQKHPEYAITTRNGEGMLINLETAAQELAADENVIGICAIGTPAAQAAISHIAEGSTNTPIGIAAVSNTTMLDIPAHVSVCGVQDTVDTHKQITCLQSIAPGITSIGILYTTSEPNAVCARDHLIQQIHRAGMHAHTYGVTNEGDIPAAVEAALSHTQALIIPTDNMLANAVSVIGEQAQAHGIPLITSDPWLLLPGVVAACGVDYEATGTQMGHMLSHRLHTPGTTNHIEKEPTNSLVYNTELINRLHLHVPQEGNT